MERARFTKLIIEDPMQESEKIANNIINQLVENTAQHIKYETIQSAEIHLLAQQLSNLEYNTLNQAYPGQNRIRPMLQDQSIISRVVQNKLPMTAKVNHLYKTLSRQSTNNLKKTRTSYFGSSSIRSSRRNESTTNLINRYEKENQENLFFPIVTFSSDDSLVSEDLIDQMRKKKEEQTAVQKKKQDFFKTMASEEERGDKIKKKWNQMMANKTYYYTNSGEAVEVKKTSKLSKKSQRNYEAATSKSLIRPQTSKRFLGFPSTRRVIPDNKAENVYVEFQNAETNHINHRQMVIFDDKEQLVFYPSKNCKYNIMA